MSELKMWVAVRTDLTMPPGKMAAQVGHGFVTALMDALHRDPHMVSQYMANSQTKIAVRVENEEALRRVHEEAKTIDIPVALIVDEGRTVFEGPTATVCAFGPCSPDILTGYLKRLRLL